MRRYETVVIANPDVPEEERKVLLDRLEGIISQKEGMLIHLDQWGMKHLAYEINKKVKGFYLCMDYLGTGALVDEIERFSRIDDRVLKFMTILKKSTVDMEKIKEEIAQKAQATAELNKKTDQSQTAPSQPGTVEEQPEVVAAAAPTDETKPEE
ncbi:MAG: 30S ribosomal protein S6 [Pseudomonadota bacterium]